MAGKFFKIGSIFLLFSMKVPVDEGHAHRSQGKSPASGP